MSADPERDVLEARARALAAPARRQVEGTELQVVVFTVGEGRYGLDAGWLQGVIPRARWTPLPGAPPALLGVAPFRGEPVATFDLRALLGHDAGPPGQTALVLGDAAPELALAVDAVEGVEPILRERLRPAPSGASAALGAQALGVREDGVTVLDAAALLADPRLTIDDEEVE